MAPQTTSTGGVAPAPTVMPRDSLSKRPNVAAVKAGKAANVHKVFDEMTTSFNDETYVSIMGVGSNNFHWSQTNEVHEDEHEFEVDEDGEGIVDAPKGRVGNYTTNKDILLCITWLQVSMGANVGGDQSRDAYWIWMKEHFDVHNTSGIDRTERSIRSQWSTINKDCKRWAVSLKAVDTINPSGTNDRDRLTIAQNLYQGEEKKTKKGKVKKERPFVFSHCYKVLKGEEKWKPRRAKKARQLLIWMMTRRRHQVMAAREALHKTWLPTPIQKDQTETRKMQKKRRRREEMARDEVTMMTRNQYSTVEERRVAAVERMVALQEKKLAMEERSRLFEWEKNLFFMDTSILDVKQKEYVNLAREEVLVQKRTMAMGGMCGIGGFGDTMGASTRGIGGMGGFGATMGGIGAMGGFGATMGGMSFGSLMGGMGAPSGHMGGHMSSGFPHIPLHDAARDDEEEEKESSSDEDEESEEEEHDDDVHHC
ncbi:putative receptor protein kinase ZmPK1 [Hordeum vulgare]|nr:putative receptor protein kinase ZmPK1 [Hordeum vulgare]